MIRAHILICGGTGCTSSGSLKLQKEFNKNIELNINDVKKLLGIDIEKSFIDDIFTNLGFTYTYENDTTFE